MFTDGAVVTDAGPCAAAGRDVLSDGGTAVDAAIASLFCMGVYHPHRQMFEYCTVALCALQPLYVSRAQLGYRRRVRDDGVQRGEAECRGAGGQGEGARLGQRGHVRRGPGPLRQGGSPCSV